MACLFIRSTCTWMALFVYHAFVLEWGVGRMAINSINYSNLPFHKNVQSFGQNANAVNFVERSDINSADNEPRS